MTTPASLQSAPCPPLSPRDHRRGDPGALIELIEYADLDCPVCAASHAVLRSALHDGLVSVVFRHFPLSRKHARAEAAHRAVEAAARQGQFWEMHDLLLENPGRLEDPDLWRYAESLEMNVERFERDRRSDDVWERVRADFLGGIRCGVMVTPTLVFQHAPARSQGGVEVERPRMVTTELHPGPVRAEWIAGLVSDAAEGRRPRRDAC